MLRPILATSLVASLFTILSAQSPPMPLADADLVIAEQDGLVAVEAEHYFQQSNADTRAFYLTTKDVTPKAGKDGDPTPPLSTNWAMRRFGRSFEAG